MTNFDIVKRDAQQIPAPSNIQPADRIQLAEAAKNGTAPLNVFTGEAHQHGPVLATVTAQAASLWVTVDSSLTVPTVRVYCADPNSAYVQAARDTRIQLNGNHLTVTVPRTPTPSRTVHHSGGTYISGSDNSYSFASISSSNGGIVINGHQDIEIELLLPSGSGLSSHTSSGSVRAFGHLEAARIDTSSGSVTLESVGRAEISSASGSVRIEAVTEWTDINSASGAINVAQHSGQKARVRAASGAITFTIAAQASGSVNTHSASGAVTVYGSNRTDMTVTATSASGSVRRR
ncbi:DUF4097 family beta strand repeat-containing protein [Streptomyces sp. NPDC055089]